MTTASSTGRPISPATDRAAATARRTWDGSMTVPPFVSGRRRARPGVRRLRPGMTAQRPTRLPPARRGDQRALVALLQRLLDLLDRQCALPAAPAARRGGGYIDRKG